jgi:hypothetical protein
MTSECPMHQEFSAAPSFRMARCCHIGDRYVVESSLLDGELTSVDYIEARDGVWVALETESWLTEPDDEQIRRTYDRFVERMRAGDPPRTHLAYERLPWQQWRVGQG